MYSSCLFSFVVQKILIVCSSREETIQTHRKMERLGTHVSGLKIKLCVSEHDNTKPNMRIGGKARKLEGPLKEHILVGTPGTLTNKKWDSTHAKLLILEEADHLLEIADNIKDILKIRQKYGKLLVSCLLEFDSVEQGTNWWLPDKQNETKCPDCGVFINLFRRQ